MLEPTQTNPALSVWDIPAALLGLALAMALSHVPVIGKHGLLWIGAPAAVVILRQKFLPKLTPTAQQSGRPLSIARKAFAYALTVLGGVIALIGGMVLYIAVAVDPEPRAAWAGLIALSIGGLIAATGLRRLM